MLINDYESENELLPAQILTILNEKFKSDTEQVIFNKRCSDLIFCSIDLDKRSMQYSGINVPVFVIKNNKLVELKTNRNEIGISEKNIKFTNHKVQLAKGDLIYILNDGFNENKATLSKSSYISDEILNVLNKIYKKVL